MDLLPALPTLSHRLLGDLAAGAMLTGSVLLALMQESSTAIGTETVTSVAQVVAGALAAGGVGTVLIKTAAGEWTKTRDESRRLDREERETERQARQAEQDQFKHLLERHLESAEVTRRYYEGQVNTMQARLDAERERVDRLLLHIIGKPLPPESGD